MQSTVLVSHQDIPVLHLSDHADYNTSELKAVTTAKVAPEIFKRAEENFLAGEYDDWRNDLIHKGYAVVKGVFSKEKAKYYEDKAREWLLSFGTDLDFDKPETWTTENLPVHLYFNAYPFYCSSHESFFWEARQEPGVIDLFYKIWGTDELLVSFDSLNVTFPNRKDVERLAGWPHVDQSPVKNSMQCVQGIINISNSGPDDGGLVVYEGSHKLFNKFFQEAIHKGKWDVTDFYKLSNRDQDWFLKQHGCKEVKICAEPGDLILWDSRTIHWGMEPTEKSNQIRTVFYVSYSPEYFATEEAIDLRIECFENWQSTTHWAHDNIVPNENHPILPNGQIDPRNRKEPLNKPEIDDRLLKLVGARPY